MQKVYLNGTWDLKEEKGKIKLKATVPGCVHTNLFKAGFIKDPFFGENEKDIRWIGEKNWEWSCSFDLSKEFLLYDRIFLCAEGLDTLGKIFLNNNLIGYCFNFYRRWEYDIKRFLKSKGNYIKIVFDSVIPFIEKKYKEHPLLQFADQDLRRVQHYAYVRKPGYQFGWDWSACFLTAGIFKDIYVLGYNIARLKDIKIVQKHIKPAKKVLLYVTGNVERFSKSELSVILTLKYNDKIEERKKVQVLNNKFEAILEVFSPKLWWINGMGEQHLYKLEILLCNKEGEIFDSNIKQIGLRTLELIQKKDRWGRSFFFEINKVPVWLGGANWVPIDSFPSNVTREKTFKLVEEASKQNMKIFRVWGGGLYGSEDFYDACDKFGILVWQDFMFACSGYPSFDKNFMENVKYEAIEQIIRIRHRASLALWCGNNEIEEGLTSDKPGYMSIKDYNKLFDDLLPKLVKKYDGCTSYIRCSGHTPGKRRDRDHSFRLDAGDTHLWWIMRGHAGVVNDMDEKKLIKLDDEDKRRAKWDLVFRVSNGLDKYDQRNIIPRFGSEYGRTSFPVLKTIKFFCPKEKMSFQSSVMECHQRGSNAWIVSEVVRLFGIPKDFSSLVLLSQISQGESMKRLVENWRINRYHNMGFLFWTYVDCWPAVEWSTVDYFLWRKASYWIFKRFYDPFIVCGQESRDLKTCSIFGINDLRTDISGKLKWSLMNFNGEIIEQKVKSIKVKSGNSSLVEKIDFKDKILKIGPNDCFLWIEFSDKNGIKRENIVSFSEPVMWSLKKPFIKIKRKGNRIILSTDLSAFWIILTIKDRILHLSDNAFFMIPGKDKEVFLEEDIPLNERINIVTLKDLVWDS